MDARQVSENWEFYFANVNDNLASIFVDVGIHDSKLDADRPWLLWVWVDLNSPREDGLTKPEEFETLCQIEDCLDETLKTAVDGICVG